MWETVDVLWSMAWPAMIALLVGAALGYYTASKDLETEKAAAWDEGYLAGIRDIEDSVETLNPYSDKNSERPSLG